MRRAFIVGLAVLVLLSICTMGTVRGDGGAPPIFVPLVCSQAPFAPPGPAITMLRYETGDECVTITNLGQNKLSLTGYRLESEPADQVYHLANIVLAPQASVRIHSGPDASDDPPDDLLWTRRYIWHDAGDIARLYDAAGVLIDVWAY